MNIKNKLSTLDNNHLKILTLVGEVASDAGLKTYLVGGMVRDLLLGIDNLDIDIAVEDDAIRLAVILAERLDDCELEAKHERFNTAKVVFRVDGKNIPIDLASTREEIYEHPAALPKVSISTLDKDLIRRDFSINALAVSLSPDEFGEVIDNFNGIEDLENKKIKVLHKNSFIDDPTRMIRAIRFSQKLGFEIEESTLEQLKRVIQSGKFDNLISSIRGDRVKVEVRYLFNLDDSVSAIESFFSSGIYKLVSLDLAYTNEARSLVKQSVGLIARFDDKKTFQAGLTRPIMVRRWLVYLAIIFKDLTYDSLTSMMKLLNLTKDEMDTIDKGLVVYSKINTLKDELSPILIYREFKKLHLESTLIARILLANYEDVSFLIDEYISKTSKIQLELTGKDLIQLGVPQGKAVGKILDQIVEEKISNPNLSKEEEIKFVKKIIAESY